jgi:hypothetical protein
MASDQSKRGVPPRGSEPPALDTTTQDSVILRGLHAYRLDRVIGEGGQGVVYEAEDLAVGTRVALKVLRNVSKGQLARFKREFRIRRRLHHRGLVEVGELALCDGRWFLTMELLHGAPLLAYVRGSEARLRACFGQLAGSLQALHAQGVVHRDVKSENVMVTDEGRTVLLDFGLALEPDDQQITQQIGTPAYMAPEQWIDSTVSEASDWYAFGALLWEALAGAHPFGGKGLELLRSKRQSEVPRVHARAPAAPADLAALCEGLLRPDPRQRFGAEQVRATFADAAIEPKRASDMELVGRHRELAELHAAFKAAAQGDARVVRIVAASGLGKSALLEKFRRSLSEYDRCWLFSARCYESESVPFNAFDSLLDELASGLRHHDPIGLERYRPRRVALLARVFPALGFLCEGRESDSALPVDPAELRERAIRSFLELLERMAELRPLVLLFDDLHWADADSCALLARLARAQFPLLIVAALREHEGGLFAGEEVVQLKLQPLDVSSASVLVAQIAGPAPVASFRAAYEDCAGNPYLLSEWARQLPHGEAQIASLLRERVERLSPAHRRLLRVVASCGAPIATSVALAAAECEGLTDVATLCDERLLCVVRRGLEHALDLYHSKLRAAALSVCDEAERAELRERIVQQLTAHGAPPEQLVEHQLAAGRGAQAAALARDGAESAEGTFAFARAAELFGLAASLTEDPAQRRALWLRQASAHQNALCPGAAADALLAAAACLEQGAAELTRRAGEQLLLAGEHSRGLATMEQALARHGLRFPATPGEALLEMLAIFPRLLARQITPRAEPADPARVERVALFTSIAQSLHHIDLRGVPFALRALLDALDLDDAPLQQRALATFVVVTASHFPNPLIEPALELCRALTERDDGYGQALLQLALTERAHFAGDAPTAERGCERAERILLDRCAGVSRELGLVRTISLVVRHSIRGDFTMAERAEAWLSDADRRGDVFCANWLRTSCALMWMAEDDPARARREIARAEAQWHAARGGTFETACALYLDALDRYEDVAALEPAQGRKSVLESPLAATELLQGYVHLQRAWACLRACAASPDDGLRKRLARALASLRGASLATWHTVADALEANACLLDGELERAEQLLEQARAGFVTGHASSLAACARRRLGEVVGGELGGRWIHEADAELIRLGVARPERYARAYWSPFPYSSGAMISSR